MPTSPRYYVNLAEILCQLRRDTMSTSPRYYVNLAEILCQPRRDTMSTVISVYRWKTASTGEAAPTARAEVGKRQAWEGTGKVRGRYGEGTGKVRGRYREGTGKREGGSGEAAGLADLVQRPPLAHALRSLGGDEHVAARRADVVRGELMRRGAGTDECSRVGRCGLLREGEHASLQLEPGEQCALLLRVRGSLRLWHREVGDAKQLHTYEQKRPPSSVGLAKMRSRPLISAYESSGSEMSSRRCHLGDVISEMRGQPLISAYRPAHPPPRMIAGTRLPYRAPSRADSGAVGRRCRAGATVRTRASG